MLDLLDRAIELLVFATEFFRRVIIDHDIGINAVTFDDPLFSVLGIKPEFRFEELAAVHQRKRIANSNNAAPGALADEFAEAKRFEAEWENIPVRCREFVDQRDHRTHEGVRWIGLRHSVARDPHHQERAPQSFDHQR